MASTPDNALANLQATALTARCHNAYFRQKQLKALHDVLRTNSAAIKDAVRQDAHLAEEEAATEVALALDIVKDHYNSIDAKKALAAEYRVANGKDADDRRAPFGVVYIEPQRSHTPFFSAIVALSGALAAGNCVALKLENNTRALPSLVRKLLAEALEADTYATVSSEPSEESLATCLEVYQETDVEEPTYLQLASPKSRVVAVVDRTADLATAAEHLVTARFAFGGTSPYAPDIVFVNEFVKKEFLEHVMRHSIRYLSGKHDQDAKASARTADAIARLSSSKDWKLAVTTQNDAMAIVELTALSTLPPKSSHPIFCISATTSLEHAISLIDAATAPPATPLLAAYFFGTPATGKYLSQFVGANASFTNHIPHRLLLGPAAPAPHAIAVDTRYTTRHFTRPAPAFIAAPHGSATNAPDAAAQMLARATREISEKKRAEWIAIGYFEQGILLGLGTVGVPILAAVCAGLWYGVGYGVRMVRR